MSKWLTIQEAVEAAHETLDEIRSAAAPGEGGIMVSFCEGPNGQRAEIFDKFDPEGDWD